MSEAKARELLTRCIEALVDEMHNGTADGCPRCDAVNAARAYLAAVPAPPAETRVPREPTPEMSATGDALAFPDHWQQLGVTADEVWRAMYDAAPAAEPVAQQPK